MVPYMTMQSVASFDHDTSNDNDSILGSVPNLIKLFLTDLSIIQCDIAHISIVEVPHDFPILIYHNMPPLVLGCWVGALSEPPK